MEVSGKIKAETDATVNKTVLLCEPCKGENKTNPADGLCKDCNEHMCNDCFRSHLRLRLGRNHVMVDGDLSSTLSMPGRVEVVVKCKQHDGETLKFFCRKHEAVGCGDCVVLNHNACKPEFISNLSKDFQQSQEFESLKSKINQLASFNDENERKIQENKQKNKSMLGKALEDIRQFRKDINLYFDKVEADAIAEAKSVMSDNEKLLTKLENDCGLLSTKIENIKQRLNINCLQDNELFINTVENKPKVSGIDKSIVEIQSTFYKRLEFVPDEQLKDILSSKKRLGRLVTTTEALTPKKTQRADEKLRDASDKKDAENNKRSYATNGPHDIGHLSAEPVTTTEALIPRKTQREDEKLRDVSDKKDAGTKSAGTVTVGSRVRQIFRRRSGIWPLGDGTVTKVHSDGTVDVKWDNIKKIRGPYKIGKGFGEVYPF